MNDKLRNYDLSYLEELSAGDSAFIKNIVTQFVAETPDVITKIKASTLQHNWALLNSLMHKFASSLSFIGLNEIKDEVKKVEASSKNLAELDEIPALVNTIVGRCELAIDWLKKDFEL